MPTFCIPHPAGWTLVEGKYCLPFPGDNACRSASTSDKCFPSTTLENCKNQCIGDCQGMSYDAGRKWCILCDSVASLADHGSWNIATNGAPLPFPATLSQFAGVVAGGNSFFIRWPVRIRRFIFVPRSTLRFLCGYTARVVYPPFDDRTTPALTCPGTCW